MTSSTQDRPHASDAGFLGQPTVLATGVLVLAGARPVRRLMAGGH